MPVLHDEGWDHLERRLASLESAYFGDRERDEQPPFMHRLQELVAKTAEIDKKIPDLQICIDLLVTKFPSLLAKKSSLKQLVEKADEILLNKESIMESVRAFEAIADLQDCIDSPEVVAASELVQRLQAVEALHGQLLQQIAAQTKELDEVVDMFEKSMLFVNRVCETWEWRLTS